MNLDPRVLRDELARLAEIAAGLLDGDDIRKIISEQAMSRISRPDRKYRFLSSDYYDVDHEPFLRNKKLLMRIERLGRVRADGAIWVRVPESDNVTLAFHNGPHHRYYQFGMECMPMPDEMQRVFATGQIVAAPPAKDDASVTVLGPVRDSLQDVVAVVEFTSPLDPQAPAFV